MDCTVGIVSRNLASTFFGFLIEITIFITEIKIFPFFQKLEFLGSYTMWPFLPVCGLGVVVV